MRALQQRHSELALTGAFSNERMLMARSETQRNIDDSIPSVIIEEFGEADKPMQTTDTQDIQDKFVEWEVYRKQTLKNRLEQVSETVDGLDNAGLRRFEQIQ